MESVQGKLYYHLDKPNEMTSMDIGKGQKLLKNSYAEKGKITL